MHLRCLLPLLLSLFLPAAAAAEPPARPHIILVMADDMGWGETSYNGHPLLKTPHLDAMAADGLRFNRFYSGAPNCSPTRATVMTGRNNDRAGVENHGYALRRQEKRYLAPSATPATPPRILANGTSTVSAAPALPSSPPTIITPVNSVSTSGSPPRISSTATRSSAAAENLKSSKGTHPKSSSPKPSNSSLSTAPVPNPPSRSSGMAHRTHPSMPTNPTAPPLVPSTNSRSTTTANSSPSTAASARSAAASANSVSPTTPSYGFAATMVASPKSRRRPSTVSAATRVPSSRAVSASPVSSSGPLSSNSRASPNTQQARSIFSRRSPTSSGFRPP